ncbi:hypothetical protein HGB25_01300 [Candidatus Saccharibacteria bacterium]|nr:hypothetical protein [Candidatus Saccharibacteria bacterium]
MKNDKFVTIKGKKYDSLTGLPVAKSATSPQKPTISNVKSITQMSRALYGRATKLTDRNVAAPIRKIGHNMDIARSKSISHFNKTTKTVSPKATPKPEVKKHTGSMDIGPIKHPMAARAEHKQAQLKKVTNKPLATKTPKQIKEHAISNALTKTTDKPLINHKKSWGKMSLFSRITIGIISLVAIGYITYINMPGLSVRVASAQAGIDASYPEYHPDGYGVNGPVTYSDGQVTIKFKATAGTGEFSIKQSKSSWDSTAVKNQVNKESKGEFITTEEHGLTIYTFDGNATWVNGGILYKISGSAPLSGEQIRRIATSL